MVVSGFFWRIMKSTSFLGFSVLGFTIFRVSTTGFNNACVCAEATLLNACMCCRHVLTSRLVSLLHRPACSCATQTCCKKHDTDVSILLKLSQHLLGFSSKSEQHVNGDLIPTSTRFLVMIKIKFGAGVESIQIPDNGLPSGAGHHLPADSAAHLPSPESSMLPHHIVMYRNGCSQFCIKCVMLSRQATVAFVGHIPKGQLSSPAYQKIDIHMISCDAPCVKLSTLKW